MAAAVVPTRSPHGALIDSIPQHASCQALGARRCQAQHHRITPLDRGMSHRKDPKVGIPHHHRSTRQPIDRPFQQSLVRSPPGCRSAAPTPHAWPARYTDRTPPTPAGSPHALRRADCCWADTLRSARRCAACAPCCHPTQTPAAAPPSPAPLTAQRHDHSTVPPLPATIPAAPCCRLPCGCTISVLPLWPHLPNAYRAPARSSPAAPRATPTPRSAGSRTPAAAAAK